MKERCRPHVSMPFYDVELVYLHDLIKAAAAHNMAGLTAAQAKEAETYINRPFDSKSICG